MSYSGIYLDSCLEPLAPWLALPDVTDIFINRPGEVWLERVGGAIEKYDAPLITAALLHRMVRQIAAVTAQGVNREHPLLAAVLPTGERVQAVIPPATRRDIAVAIRKQVVNAWSLGDYVAAGAFKQTRLTDGMPTAMPSDGRDILFEGDIAFCLAQAVRNRLTILVSGGTSTGKTTFLNALLGDIPRSERLIIIEDTPELVTEHANSVGLVSVRGGQGEAKVTPDDLLIASLRMRPDRVILGEIRGDEVATFLRAINTGHPGSISTIHADSPARAIDQVAFLMMRTGTTMAWNDIVQYVRRSIDIVVQLERGPAGRSISEVALLRQNGGNKAAGMGL